MIHIPTAELLSIPDPDLAQRYRCSVSTVRQLRSAAQTANMQRTLSEAEQARRTMDERRVFGLLLVCYSRAMQAGVPWEAFIQCFRRQLPALLAHTEDIPDGIRVYGAEVQTSLLREAI